MSLRAAQVGSLAPAPKHHSAAPKVRAHTQSHQEKAPRSEGREQLVCAAAAQTLWRVSPRPLNQAAGQQWGCLGTRPGERCWVPSLDPGPRTSLLGHQTSIHTLPHHPAQGLEVQALSS